MNQKEISTEKPKNRWVELANKGSTVIFIVLLIFFLYRFGKIFFYNQQFEGKEVSNFSLVKEDGQVVNLHSLKLPVVLMYWHTQCPPCIVELKRINSSMKEGEIPRERIIAVNMGETFTTIRRFKNKYQMMVDFYQESLEGPRRNFGIIGTPTQVFINKEKKINTIKTGASPMLIKNIVDFLKY
jgi:peroxiredoxin